MLMSCTIGFTDMEFGGKEHGHHETGVDARTSDGRVQQTFSHHHGGTGNKRRIRCGRHNIHTRVLPE